MPAGSGHWRSVLRSNSIAIHGGAGRYFFHGAGRVLRTPARISEIPLGRGHKSSRRRTDRGSCRDSPDDSGWRAILNADGNLDTELADLVSRLKSERRSIAQGPDDRNRSLSDDERCEHLGREPGRRAVKAATSAACSISSFGGAIWLCCSSWRPATRSTT